MVLTTAASSPTHKLELFDLSNVLLDTDSDDVAHSDSEWLAGGICYDGSNLAGRVTGHGGIDLCVGAPSVNPGRQQVRLGGNADARFDNFTFDKVHDASDPSDEHCGHCTYCTQVCSPELAPCCQEPMTVGPVVVDFGVGGWTSRIGPDPNNDECDPCALVAGEIVLFQDATLATTSPPPCGFAIQLGVCPTGFGWVCSMFGDSGNLYLYVTAAVVSISPADPEYTAERPCRWSVVVTFGGGCSTFGVSTTCDGGDDNVISTAQYYSEPIARTDCNILPVLLTKSSELTNGCPCQGTLPATITLHRA